MLVCECERAVEQPEFGRSSWISNAKLRVMHLLSAEKSALENLFIVAIARLIGKHGLTAYFSSVILIGCQFM
jgi:hypothetical protein